MKKTLLAAAALVCVVASPAFAQSYDPDIGSGNLDSWPYTSNPDNPYHSRAQISPYGAYGFVPNYGDEYRAWGFDPNYGTVTPRHRRHREVR